MLSGRKMMTQAPVVLQVPEQKLAAETGTMSGPLVPPASPDGTVSRRKHDVVQTSLRLLCLVTSLTALSFMVAADQAGTVYIYGFRLPVHSKWSFSGTFEYLVGVCGVVAAHSFLQLLISVPRLLKKYPIIASRNHLWLIFVADQVLAYAMLSAGSAASGVTNLNRTGVRHTALPNFCEPLHIFCERVAVSIAFVFITFLFLTISAAQNVIWLSKYNTI